MIARSNTIQDLEGQHVSSSADPLNAEAGIPFTAGNVNTSSPTQDENSPCNGQEADGDLPNAAFVNGFFNEAGHVTDDDWPGFDPAVGEAITQSVSDSTQYVDPKVSARHC